MTASSDIPQRGAGLAYETTAIRELGAGVLDATDIGTYAVEYALNNWAVFPLRGKVPAIRRENGGRGVLDATTDITTVITWWSGRYAGCNIGGRVPENMFVLDIDPRHDGLESLAALQKMYGRLPATLTTISGRGDGGRHVFFRRPAGRLVGGSATGSTSRRRPATWCWHRRSTRPPAGRIPGLRLRWRHRRIG